MRVGMSKLHPWAFQLSAEELERVEADVLKGDIPVPLVEIGGMIYLMDPFRAALRAKRWER